MKELILGDIPENYDPKKHYLLGAWTLFKKQELLEKLDKAFPDLFPTRDQFDLIEAHTGYLADKYLPQLASYLNKKNNSNYTEEFWRIITRDKLVCFISSVLEKYYKLSNFQTDESFKVVLSEVGVNHIFEEAYEFDERIQVCELYNSYLFSLALKMLNPSYIKEYDTKAISIPKKTQIVSGTIAPLRARVINKICEYTRIQSIFGFNIIQIFLLNFFCLKNKNSSTFQKYIPFNTSLPLEENILSADWFSLLVKNLSVDFHNIKKFKKKMRIYKNGIFICSSFKTPTSSAFRIATMKMKGVKIFSSQHGSAYGDFHSFTRNNLSELNLDGFFTWGWSNYGHSPERLHALPSPQLSKVRKKYKKQDKALKKKILLVSTCFQRFCWSACSGYDSQHFHDYLNRIERIFTNLPSSVKKSFYFRPRFSQREVSYFIIEPLEKKYSDIKVLNNNLDYEFVNSKLIIFDSPGSALYKSLAANIPTIITWNPRAWLMSDRFSEHLEKFKEVGIFFESPEYALKKVEQVQDDTDRWWNSSEVQKVVQDFCNEFARVSDSPFSDWYKYLKKL
tara:strand:+ start:5833 stop:7524 length:1692 start_codon:yes stop_codon:yes gene_type:complete